MSCNFQGYRINLLFLSEPLCIFLGKNNGLLWKTLLTIHVIIYNLLIAIQVSGICEFVSEF